MKRTKQPPPLRPLEANRVPKVRGSLFEPVPLPHVKVRVYPDCHQPHVLQLYAGLYDLDAERRINLELSPKVKSPVREYTDHTLWMEFDYPTEKRTISLCFDMLDGGRIASRPGLENCDAYVKRSYSQQIVDTLPSELGRKIVPFGLNYPCLSNSQRLPGKHVLSGFRLTVRGRKTSFRVDRESFQRTFQLNLAHKRVRGTKLCPYLRARDFEVSPLTATPSTILFQTRLWEGQTGLNADRVGLVQALRREFGDRFVGGLENTSIARREFPDLITPMSRRKRDYIRLVSRNLIAVTTTGLFDSTGWKLPEYFAASRCIVSSPPRYRLPVPLRPGVHYLSAHSTDEFVGACSHILTDAKFADNLRRSAWTYYLRNIEPSALMHRCLRTALNLAIDGPH